MCDPGGAYPSDKSRDLHVAVAKLRQIDVHIGQEMTRVHAINDVRMIERTYDRYGLLSRRKGGRRPGRADP